MVQETLQSFHHPDTLVKEYEHWMILCRPSQPTLGSLILICKDDVGAFSDISSESFQEFSEVIKEIEKTLKICFSYEKINYMMYMMVDPAVHFHVIPRYGDDKIFEEVVFVDEGWPKPPNTKAANELSEEVFRKLVDYLRNAFA